MAATPEKKVKTKVRSILKTFDAYAVAPVTGGYGTNGTPDILACIQGRFVGIECKAGNNKPTALQEAALAEIERAGGIALVIDDSNVDMLPQILNELL